jgi:hypothetical protein
MRIDFPRLVRGVALVAASQKNISEEVRWWNAINAVAVTEGSMSATRQGDAERNDVGVALSFGWT